MKKSIGFAAAFALFASTQAFAIGGAGAHYVMNLGSSLDPSSGTVRSIDVDGVKLGDIKLNQKGANGLQGIGFKGWIDLIPVVDIEGTFNFAATRYDASLSIDGLDKDIPLSYSPDAPYNMIFDKASPIYGVASGDLSILYPPFDIPILKPYIGAGVSYMISIPIVNASFAKSVINEKLANSLVTGVGEDASLSPAAAKEVGNAVIKALKDAEYKSGFGCHAIIGLRIKAPVIPIALYANGKYYLGGGTDDQFSQGFVVELGGGLAL